ncbi:hypothetical protein [Pseudonocardia acaciae]|uniref:hypothetical protein n=1 Tax=Pseudonocardia acaciae TaxID=551276 RepID=UPI00048C244A|nr:hypothetical protein [Pseudonocardia acaciae]
MPGRQELEVGLPGIGIGLVAGVFVGGLAVVVGQPVGWALVGALVLGVLLAAVGAFYGVMLARGWARPGVFAPAALAWLVGFPLARLVHATFTPVLLGGPATPPADLAGFLAFQGIISLGYAVGFIWLHERIAPHWLARIGGHNPVAARVFDAYRAHAEMVYRQRERRRARRRERTG